MHFYTFFRKLLILLNARLLLHMLPIKSLGLMFLRIQFRANLKNKIDIRDDLSGTNTTMFPQMSYFYFLNPN